MAEVVALKTKSVSKPKKASRPRPASPVKSAVAKNRLKWQGRLGMFTASMGTMLLFLSVTHLATGIQSFTQGHFWEALACAIVIDLGFIGLEMTQLLNLSETIRKEVDKYAKPAIYGTLGSSAIINAYVFSSHSEGYMVYAAAIIGLMTPVLTYCLFRVSAVLVMNANR
jgi:hypothetical protein